MAENNKTKWLILLTVMVGTFIGYMNGNVASLALTKIMLDFNITSSEASWISTAYILASAVFVSVWGKLGDTIGRKKVYLLGLSVFIIGSILAAFSWNLGSMIFFRVIQAIAVSADYPTAMAIIVVTFSNGKERAMALGLWSTAIGASIIAAPLMGGPLIDIFSWRSIFLMNIPLGLFGIALALAFIQESSSEKKSISFDWYGALTLGSALALFILGLNKGYEWGWSSLSILACFAGAGLFLYVFYLIDSRHPEPIIDFDFFRIPAFTHTLANNFAIFMCMQGSLFLITIFCQMFLGLTATETGYLFIPMAVCMMLGAPVGASLVGKFQPRYVIALSTLTAGFGFFLFMGLDVRSGPLDIIIPLSIMTFGMGFGMSQRTSVVAAVVPKDEIGNASAVLALARNVAGAFGVAIFTTLLNNSIEDTMLSLSANSLVNVHTPAVFQEVYALMYLDAEVLAYHTVYLAAAGILFVAAALSLLIDVKKTTDGKDVTVEI